MSGLFSMQNLRFSQRAFRNMQTYDVTSC